MAATSARSAPSSSFTAPSARVSITADTARQRSITSTRERAPSMPPVAIANPGEIASIHCRDDAPALACRLTSAMSACSASPTRASNVRSAAASTSPASSIEPPSVATRSTQCLTPWPATNVWKSTPSQCHRESRQRSTGSRAPGQPAPARTRPMPRSKANNATAFARSASSEGSICRSTSIAAESSNGSTTSRRRLPRVPQASPVSNSRLCDRVRIHTAVPRPASRTMMRASPVGTSPGIANASGNAATPAVKRSGQGHWHNPTHTAGSATKYQDCGGTTRQVACGRSAHHVSAGHSASYSTAAISKNGAPSAGSSQDPSAPASTMGTNTNEITGMAMRLTASPTSDIDPNTAKPAGASASMTASCVRTGEVWPDRSNTPTATNDSQNPADNAATGSRSRTTTRASDHRRPAPT